MINNGGVLQKIEGPTLKGRVFWEIVKEAKTEEGSERREKEKEIKLKPIRIHEEQ